MKRFKIIRSILIPTLGISVIGTIATVCTSCGNVVHVESVTLDKSSTTLNVGQTETLTATVLPEDATDKKVNWTSSDTNIATIKNGTITTVAEGTATIIVKTNDGGKTATCEVTVKDKVVPVTGVTLNKTSTTLNVGVTETLVATVLPEDATEKSVTWTSNNPSVATVDNNGKITAIAIGTAEIIATSVDNPDAHDTCKVEVNTIHVESVTLDITSTILDVGGTKTLTATVSPQNATNKDVTWSSSDQNVVTVENGKITAIGLGKATITVTSVDNQNAEATCEVNVTNPYVAITANENSTLILNDSGKNNPNLQYSTNGTNWTTYREAINITKGKRLYLRGNNPDGWSHNWAGEYSILSIKGDVSISGNVMGLLDNGAKSGEQGDITDIPCNCCFYKLFEKSTGITSISKSFLPARDLKDGCYAYMFNVCTSLTTAPELPATTLANECYSNMFQGCSSLTTAPDLPARDLADSCYVDMFENCTSLTTAPKLPATTLTDGCYYAMFYGCSSLTTAPDLPAIILANGCYYGMFRDCSALTTAPDLPAASLVEGCYQVMFCDCKSLNSIKIGYTGDYDSDYFFGWVNGVAPTGTFYYSGNETAQDFGFPSGWIIKADDSYVVITANANSALTLNNNGGNNPNLQYSINSISWTTHSGETINITKGKRLYLRGNNPSGWSHSSTRYSTLSITGDVSISGNVMGLLDNAAKSWEQSNIANIPCDYCFYNLFRDSTRITSVSKSFLPARTLANDCYRFMFQNCSSLSTVPDLPARTLANDCYRGMFNGCSSLTTAPDLPARTLANDCYSNMFQGCSSLTTAPDLPALNLANNCYSFMFSYCSLLTTVPALPATDLAVNCYRSMFSECTSLTTAPKLPATTLKDGCYIHMFQGCSSLSSIKIGYTGNYNYDYFNNWVNGVAPTGTFYYNGNGTLANFGFLDGWTKSW